jgi:ABC-type nickel/cobalt efflux system permease component RcnA
MSFFYGVFHAVGPGHGKFILTGYLSMTQTKLPQAMRISLFSALVQGLVAVVLVSVVVVAFTLSRSYFNLTVQWVERGSFALMILLGLYWSVKAIHSWHSAKKPNLPKIRQIRPLASGEKTGEICQIHHHDEHCGCGHQHLPNAEQMQDSLDWKAQLMLIFSIGSRPCSGAILVLFLAYMLDLYLWGVLSAFAMALGTGLTLSAFAILVLFARQQAVKISAWYLPANFQVSLRFALRLAVGVALIIFGILLLHGSLLEPVPSGFLRR